MYLVPQAYRCPKCGFECKYSPHDLHPAPVVQIRGREFVVCPSCYRTWILETFVSMDPVPTEPKKIN
jgi:predicted RNA-binding Zn-ribbon protein involved in translation (DUF1610 family)